MAAAESLPSMNEQVQEFATQSLSENLMNVSEITSEPVTERPENQTDVNKNATNTDAQYENQEPLSNGTKTLDEKDDGDDDDDDMPDLVWPDKSKSKGQEQNTSEMTPSSSQDTGFESGNASERTSPADTGKTLAEQLHEKSKDETTEDNSADIKTEETMDILGNGLLMKKILVPGQGVDTRPNNGDVVTVKVEGHLEDGTTVDDGEVTFNLNEGDVILAFDLAVALMEAREKCELSTAPRYAYGSQGRSPDIPSDASITYTLELLDIKPAPDVSSMTWDERLKFGEAKRERGNYLFSRTDFCGAINSYTKGVKLLDEDELNSGLDESSRSLLTESWVKCYNNMAACQLKIDALDAAIRSCEKVLSAQENNVKALFRIGKAYSAKGDIDQAITYVRKAIKLDPESKLLHQEMLNLSRRKNKEAASEKELYQRMLGVKPGENPFAPGRKKKDNSNGLLKWTLAAGGVAAMLVAVGLTWFRTS